MKHSLCFALALAAPVFAGLRIEMDSTDLTTGTVTKREVLVDADRLRLNETGKNGNSSVLFLTDGGRNRIVVLDTAKNEYREIDQQTINQLSGQLGQTIAALAQMQAQMKNMTPEQRAAMEQMMKGRGMPTAATPVRTVYTAKGSGSANGYACTKYDGNRGAEKVSEICAANPSDLKFSAADFQVYEKMKEFAVGLQSIANSPFGGGAVAAVTDTGFSGFPVQQTSFKSGQPVSRVDAKSIDRASFGDGDFSVGNATKVELIPAQVRGKQ